MNRWEAIKATSARVVRLIKAFLGVAVAGGIGWLIGGLGLAPVVDGRENAKTVLLGGAGLSLLSLAKEFLDALPKIWKYVTDGEFRGLYDFLSFVLLTVLSMVLASAFYSAKGKPPEAARVGESVLFVQSGHHPKFSIPFPKEAQAEGCGEANIRYGADFSEGSQKFIEQLGNGLSACGSSQRRVQVDVVGYASSSEFTSDGRRCPDSDALNLKIADARAERVATVLRTNSGNNQQNVLVKHENWGNDDFDKMRDGARFNDLEPSARKGSTIGARGDLTRRVDIVVTSAGDCEPDN